MKIFLLEDDYSLNKAITKALEHKGFLVESHFEGDDAVDTILQSKYDIYILDINVPNLDGYSVLDIIKKENSKLPVIMISASLQIDQIKKAYDLGCNDYLKKPFELEELFLRIDYLIKTTLINNENKSHINLGGGYFFNLENSRLYKHEHEIDLTPKESLLLFLLASNRGNTVGLDLIREYVWDGKDVEFVSIRTIVHKLQKKIKNGLIVNLRGVGYKLLENEK
ncbi:MAG: response regulator transcription factor [Candidatus Marinarcus sp.]|uniref:response regulator transcription factor n=1 Tax=Candidatus Marinarcus sp. TaxID=3100987 RepID=UPI003B005316